MKRYEMVREIFNQCSGNQMRDIFIEEIETDFPEAKVRSMCVGKDVSIEQLDKADGTIIFDVVIAGQKQRFTFSEI